MVERNGRIKAKHLKLMQTHIILDEIKSNVAQDAKLMTDEYKVYKKTKLMGYNHQSMKHSHREYAVGEVHTNTIEGFWSQLKGSIHGTYHVISPKYLQAYVNEFSFRYNRRASELPAFFHLLNEVVG